MSASYGDKLEPIAIIGAACRFPGGVTAMGDLWNMISHSRSTHSKFPSGRLDANSLFHPDPSRQGSLSMKHGFFLQEDISLFDAPFFSTTAKEAAGLDPMKRMLLEVSYEGFENAGIPIKDLAGSQTGVYVGCMTNDYEMLSTRDTQDLPHNAATGLSEALTANRVSWFFDLHGPSFTIDTACSSSLSALHLACQSLQSGESDMGLVAGVNLILYPNYYKQMAAMYTLSPEGISHVFDRRANGYARGEGIGALVIKRLKDALRDGDTIRAVIRGTGINSDGKTIGITMPSSNAQADLIRQVYEKAGLSYSDTTFFETHGTGTPLGDPTELEAIGMTFGEQRAAHDLLYIGSIKGNFGHTEGCSGLAGVFKSLLCLEHGKIVPTAGFEYLNPKLKLSEWKLTIPMETMPWPTRGQRRISINSFGFGGANAHVIMDDSYHYLKERGLLGNHVTSIPDEELSDSGISIGSETPAFFESKKLFIFSAKDQASLKDQVSAYAQFLEKRLPDFGSNETGSLNDLAYTLSHRRSHFDFRSFVVSASASELSEGFQKGLSITKRSTKEKNVIFIFTGQGANWPCMGTGLDNYFYQESLKKTEGYLCQLGCSWNLTQELQRKHDSNIDNPEFSQPICTAIQIALTDLLYSWGIRPAAVVGHSSGEIGAAYAAGAICHQTAIQIAYYRGLCAGKVAHLITPRVGAMLAAGLTQEEASRYIQDVAPDSVVIGCVNSPSSVTISGDEESILLLEALISKDGKFARKLHVQTAYHSPHMRTVAHDYLEYMRDCPPSIQTEKGCLMFSSVTGNLISPKELSSQYWVRNLCEPVQFSDALSNLLAYTENRGIGRRNRMNWSAVIECGPHCQLKGPTVEQLSESLVAKQTPYMSILHRGKDAIATSLAVAGILWSHGHELNLLKVNSQECQIGKPKTLTDLPGYSWNHKKGFWHETESSKSVRLPKTPRIDLLGMPVENQNFLEPAWRNFLRISENPWIEHHKITGTILYPAAGMLVMVIEAAKQIAASKLNLEGIHFERVSFERGLVVPFLDEAVETSLSIRHHETLPHHYTFAVFSTKGGSWTRHCSGAFAAEYRTERSEVEEDNDGKAEWATLCAEYEEIKLGATLQVNMERLYSEWAKIGLEYGELFRNVIRTSAHPVQNSAHASIRIPDTRSRMPYEFEYPHVIHPATMDAIFHIIFVAFGHGKPMKEAAVPFTLEYMFVAADLPREAGHKFLGYAKARKHNGREISGDLVVWDESWTKPKIRLQNFTFRQVSSNNGTGSAALRSSVPGPEPRTTRIEWKEDVGFLYNTRLILENNVAPRPAVGIPAFFPALHEWLERLHHKKPDSTGLLICCDTLAESPEVMELFTSDHKHMLSKCLVITGGKEPKATFKSKIQELDIEITFRDPADDSEMALESNTLDFILVVAMNDSESTQMRNISKAKFALRTGGHLIVLHTIQQFTSLGELGFMPPMVIRGPDETRLMITVLEDDCANRVPTSEKLYLLVARLKSDSVLNLVKHLTTVLSADGYQVHEILLSQIDQVPGQQIISLLEVQEPFISRWTNEEFDQFKLLLLNVRHMLWITSGDLLQNSQSADFGPTTGLIRVIRTERPQITLPHLDLSVGKDLSSPDTANIISAVWKSQGLEMEYAEKDSILFIPRVVGYEDLDYELERVKGRAQPIKSPLSSDRPLEPQGLPASEWVWCDDEKARMPLASGEVEIKVEYASLSLPTTDPSGFSSSELATSDALASEAVGIISKRAPDVEELTVGTRVIVFKPNSCRTHIRQHHSLVQVVPLSISPLEITALPKAFIAAQYALLLVAGLERNMSVLIHGAAGGLGQAAIQVARHVDAKIWATVSSRVKRDVLIQHYGIDGSCIFDSKHQNVASGILQATQSQGVDVILYTHWSPEVRASLSCLREHGYIMDLSKNENCDLPLTKRNTTIARIDIENLSASKPGLIKSLFAKTIEMCKNKVISPIIPTTGIPVSESKRAVEKMQSRRNHGKVVLDFTNNASVLTLPRSIKLQLDPQGTYILAGGLGTLGISTAETMIRHGAGHVVFLSRSGGTEHHVDLDSFRALGVKVETLKCDINILADVKNIARQLKDCKIRGLIQCAMLLEDSVFDNMSFDQWRRATNPKIEGTKNLHKCLPDNLDFFIMMSSVVSIIGNGGQANYAAGNAFQDAFAHYRAAQGLAATSINIGLVFSDYDVKSDVKKYASLVELQTTQEELQMVLEIAMRGSTANGVLIAPQFALGIGDSLHRNDDKAMVRVWLRDSKFDHRVSKSSDTIAAKPAFKLKDDLSKAISLNDAVRLIESLLEEVVTLLTGGSSSAVDFSKPLYEYGVDSLQAVEVRNRIFRDVQATLSIFEVLNPTSLSKLSFLIIGRSELVRPELAKQAIDEVQD